MKPSEQTIRITAGLAISISISPLSFHFGFLISMAQPKGTLFCYSLVSTKATFNFNFAFNFAFDFNFTFTFRFRFRFNFNFNFIILI